MGVNMTCHQKKIRDKHVGVPPTLDQSIVREIETAEGKPLILTYEWLGNMGTTEHAYGLSYLGGVVCFGSTAGAQVPVSICGKEYADRVTTLCRGACAPWVDHQIGEHTGAAASHLIHRACDMMARDHSKNIFVAYSDVDAGEIRTVYQAAGWLYVGKGGTPSFYVHPDGRRKDARCIGQMIRSRRGRPNDAAGRILWGAEMRAKGHDVGGSKTPYIKKMTRQQAVTQLLAEGFVLERGVAKHRYVHFAGDKRMVRALRKALKLKVLPYPKRDAAQFEANTAGTTNGGEVRLLGAAPKDCT